MSDVARVYGPSSVAVAKEKLGSTLGATQLTLEVHCVALCDNDVRMSRGELAELCAPLPYVPGHCVSGVARQLGGAVEHLKADDRVVGLLPMMEDGAAREKMRADALCFVRVPDGLDMIVAAALLEPALRAFTALHYQAHTLRGEVVLVLDAAAGSAGEVVMQLAVHRELRVLAVVASREQATVLEARFQSRIEVIVVTAVTELAAAVLARTGQLGVDCVFESVAAPLDAAQRKARIACLSAHGRWCVAHALQLDPPEARALLLRCASLSFAWPQVWCLHPLQRGRYLQVANEVMRLASDGKLRVSHIDRFPLAKVGPAIDAVPKADGSVVVVTSAAAGSAAAQSRKDSTSK